MSAMSNLATEIELGMTTTCTCGMFQHVGKETYASRQSAMSYLRRNWLQVDDSAGWLGRVSQTADGKFIAELAAAQGFCRSCWAAAHI